jgi:hypothetical protein
LPVALWMGGRLSASMPSRLLVAMEVSDLAGAHRST